MSSVRENPEKKYDKEIIIDDDNFLNYYYKDNIECEITFHGYFYFFDILEKNRDYMKKLFKIKYEERDENNLFIHYRLGDINNSNFTLPIEYFIESIENTNFDVGYIARFLRR